MSHKATNWAIEQRGLKPAAKIVLWHLADRHHPDNGCFPSQETLADDCEMSRSTLNLHLADLEKRGLIKRIQRSDRTTKRQKSTYYLLGFELAKPSRRKTGKPQKPCPKTGHGAVSEKGEKPCPKIGKSRVLKSDTNPVREPVNNPCARTKRYFSGDEDFDAREISKILKSGGSVNMDAIQPRIIECMIHREFLTLEEAEKFGISLEGIEHG